MILQKPNYRIGLSMNPFEIRNINATGMPVPTKIPVKTKASFLSIIHKKLFLVGFNIFALLPYLEIFFSFFTIIFLEILEKI